MVEPRSPPVENLEHGKAKLAQTLCWIPARASGEHQSPAILDPSTQRGGSLFSGLYQIAEPLPTGYESETVVCRLVSILPLSTLP